MQRPQQITVVSKKQNDFPMSMLKVKTCLVTGISVRLFNLFTNITTPVNSVKKGAKSKFFVVFHYINSENRRVNNPTELEIPCYSLSPKRGSCCICKCREGSDGGSINGLKYWLILSGNSNLKVKYAFSYWIKKRKINTMKCFVSLS